MEGLVVKKFYLHFSFLLCFEQNTKERNRRVRC